MTIGQFRRVVNIYRDFFKSYAKRSPLRSSLTNVQDKAERNSSERKLEKADWTSARSFQSLQVGNQIGQLLESQIIDHSFGHHRCGLLDSLVDVVLN